jgi:epoxyqueuosine reductase QueG
MAAVLIEDLRGALEMWVAAEPGRLGAAGWWRKPLLAAAPVDARFDLLPRIAAADHWLPRDLLPTANSVIVFFIPFRRELVRGNQAGERPCRDWGVAYVQTNELILRTGRALGELLEARGFRCALTPATHNFNEETLTARWSHKHLGHLVNLGRFGTHRMLITPAGCAGRLGSLVTEADVGDNPLVGAREACLLKAGKPCGLCMAACPVHALTVDGFDRRRCWERLKENQAGLADFAGLPETTHVCGKCVSVMPCSVADPVARLNAALR